MSMIKSKQNDKDMDTDESLSASSQSLAQSIRDDPKQWFVFFLCFFVCLVFF
jgi:hypothetical protein